MAIATQLSAETLGAILDSLNIGVVFVNRQNDVQVFNTTAGEMLGEDPAARIGSSLLLCHPAESEAAVLQRVDDLGSGRKASTQNWLNYRGRLLREYILPARDSGGEVVGTLLLIHDAAAHIDCLKRLGEWTEVKVSGVGARAPRAPRAAGGIQGAGGNL